jgi:hypothetical protein
MKAIEGKIEGLLLSGKTAWIIENRTGIIGHGNKSSTHPHGPAAKQSIVPAAGKKDVGKRN